MHTEEIRVALRAVIDPELGVNIVDLGLLYGIEVQEGAVRIKLTMTSPACPLTDLIRNDAIAALQNRWPELTDVTVEFVWDPPWHPSLMTEAAKAQLGWHG